jgi:hypothetical protein
MKTSLRVVLELGLGNPIPSVTFRFFYLSPAKRTALIIKLSDVSPWPSRWHFCLVVVVAVGDGMTWGEYGMFFL